MPSCSVVSRDLIKSTLIILPKLSRGENSLSRMIGRKNVFAINEKFVINFPPLRFSSFQIESVELALNVLDGYEFRGNKISVTRAEFQMRGEYNPALKPRMRKNDKEKMKKMQEK